MIPNICWTLTVHDGIKPIKRHHPELELVGSQACVKLISRASSASWLPDGSFLPAFVCTLVRTAFVWPEMLTDYIHIVHQQGLNTDPDHLKAMISIFKVPPPCVWSTCFTCFWVHQQTCVVTVNILCPRGRFLYMLNNCCACREDGTNSRITSNVFVM